MDEFEKWPEIGSRAAAVKSCVSLLSAVCGQPETVMERWLDLYYQVRHDKEKADAAARAAERLKEMAQLEAVLEPFQSPPRAAVTAPPEGEPRAELEPEPPPETKAEKAAPSQSAAPTAPPKGEPSAEPEALRENRVKRPGGKGKPRPQAVGNTISHDSAVFKRKVRDRLEAVRKKGVSAPSLVKAATTAGAFTANNIYEILEGKVLKIEIYRALDEALWHFEN